MSTFQGEPLHSEFCWVVIRRQRNGTWWPLETTMARTRSEAIQKYNRYWPSRPGQYNRERRRGEAKAVHCEIRPMVFGEDR